MNYVLEQAQQTNCSQANSKNKLPTFISMPGLLISSSIIIFYCLSKIIFIDGVSKNKELFIYFLSFSLIPIFNLCLLKWINNWKIDKFTNNFFICCLQYLIIVCMLAYSMQGSASIAFSNPNAFSISYFLSGCFLGYTFFTILLYDNGEGQSKLWLRLVKGIAICICVLALVGTLNYEFTLEVIGYGPYFGPALAYLYGGTPFIDVFSQYGISYLLYAAALKLNYSTASLLIVTSILNTILYIIVACIALRICKNKFLALLLVTLGVYSVIYAYPMNIVLTPSVMGARFLPLYFLVLTLVAKRKFQSFDIFSIASLILCSMWAIEILVFGFLIFVTYTIAGQLLEKKSLSKIFQKLAICFIIILIPHLILSCFYLIKFHALPRYDIYLEIIRYYATNDYWFVASDFKIKASILVGLTYIIALSCIFHQIFLNKSKVELASQKMMEILPIVVLGILQFSYYVSRPTGPLLAVVAFPFILICARALDWAIENKNNMAMHSSVVSILGASFFIFSIIAGVVFTKIVSVSPTYLLSRAFTYYDSPIQIRSATPRLSHDLLNTSNGVL